MLLCAVGYTLFRRAATVSCALVITPASRWRLQLASTPGYNPECSICGKEVSLHDCKTDEQGRAVHEACYAEKIMMMQGISSRPSTNGGFDAES